MTRKPTILVVDDNEIQRYAMSKTLAGAGFDTTSAESGKQALAMAREAKPDLVLLDVFMPELDGFGLFLQLREDTQTRNVPVVFYSANEGFSRARAYSLGAKAFLTYPMNPDHLFWTVKGALR